MNLCFRPGLLVVAATLLFSSVGSAITIFSESFGDPPNALGLNVNPPQWVVVSGAVDVVNNLQASCTAPSGNNCLDINGSAGTAGVLRSNRRNDLISPGALALFTGNTYTFSYYVEGSHRPFGGAGPNFSNTMTWRVFDTVTSTVFASGTETLNANQNALLRTQSLSGITGTFSNVRIEFNGGVDGDNVGLIIDDILLDCAGPNCANQLATPEPASLALIGAGLILIGFRLRR